MVAFEIGAMVASLKAAGDITKAIVGLRDAAAIQGKVIELQGVILSAQGAAMVALGAHATLLEQASLLEKEVAQLKAWDAEKQKYHLSEVATGCFVYAVKPDSGSAEPMHSLCANCFHDGHKSILQADRKGSNDLLQCHRCDAVIVAKRHVAMPVVVY